MPPPQYSWLLSEDHALKTHLQGLTVVDLNDDTGRDVPVYFRDPQKEVRTQNYPYISIHFQGFKFSRERAQRGYVEVARYYPVHGYTADGNGDTVDIAELPLPVDIIYTITANSRNPLHDRQMVASLLQYNRIPPQGGALTVDDNTVRRLDLIGMDPANLRGQDGFPIYRKIFTVLVSSEIWTIPTDSVPLVTSDVTVVMDALESQDLDEETFAITPA